MTRFSAGIVMTGSDGYVHVRIWDKSYFICPEDMGMLLFVGETVPLLHKNPDPSGPAVTSGSVALNPSGRDPFDREYPVHAPPRPVHRGRAWRRRVLYSLRGPGRCAGTGNTYTA